MHDIIIVGGGPAGLTAALYARRNGKTALIIEKESFGGQMTHSPRIANYPGFPSVSGNELAEKMLSHALDFGAEIEIDSVSGIRDDGDGKTVLTESGAEFPCRAVILATGVRHRPLGLEGEEELIGEGVSYCAVCDGDFYAGKKVCVAGGGNSALQEALLLSDKCAGVTVLQDLDRLTGEASLQEALLRRPNVTVKTCVRLQALERGGSGLSGVRFTDTRTGEAGSIPCDGLFVAIGLIPENGAFAALADLTQEGYFDADERCLTRTAGIFAAGDCRRKEIRQIATAVADGAAAALAACRYLQR